MKVLAVLCLAVALVAAGPPSITQVRDRAMKVLRGIRPDSKSSVPSFLQEVSESSPKLSIQAPPHLMRPPRLPPNPALYHRAIPLNIPQPIGHGGQRLHGGFGELGPFGGPSGPGPFGGSGNPFGDPPGISGPEGGPGSIENLGFPGPINGQGSGSEDSDRVYHQAASLLPNLSPDKLLHSNQHTIVYHKQPGEELSEQELKGLHKIPKMPNGSLPPQVIIQDDKEGKHGLQSSASGHHHVHGGPVHSGGGYGGPTGPFGGGSAGPFGGGHTGPFGGGPSSNSPVLIDAHFSRHHQGHRKPGHAFGSFGGLSLQQFINGHGHGGHGHGSHDHGGHGQGGHGHGSHSHGGHSPFGGIGPSILHHGGKPQFFKLLPGSGEKGGHQNHGSGISQFIFGGGSGEREHGSNDLDYDGGKHFGERPHFQNIPVMMRPPQSQNEAYSQSSRPQVYHQPVSYGSSNYGAEQSLHGGGQHGPVTLYQNPGPLPLMHSNHRDIVRYKTSPITVSVQKQLGSGERPIVLSGDKTHFVQSFAHELDTAATKTEDKGAGVIQVIIKPFSKDAKVLSNIASKERPSVAQESKEARKTQEPLIKAIPIFQFSVNGQPIGEAAGVQNIQHLAQGAVLQQFGAHIEGIHPLTPVHQVPLIQLNELQSDFDKIQFPVISDFGQNFGFQYPLTFPSHTPVSIQSLTDSSSQTSSGASSQDKKATQKEKEKDGQQLTTLFQQTPHGLTPLKSVYLPNSVVKSIMKQAGIKVPS